MAKVHGESGRYVSNEAMRQKNRIVWFCIVMVGICGAIEGIVISGYFPTSWLSGLNRLAVLLVVLFMMLASNKWGMRKVHEIEKRYENMTRGATGEILVGQILGKFPNDFCVINDLPTPNGNIDHVVVGPTGVFVLDAKAWRGLVTADGKGELLLNGKPTEKPFVRQFVGRMMGIKDKVLVLAPGVDAHFNAVFVFTSARVEARWGTTSSANCITDEQLYKYIVEKNFGKKLSPAEISRISQAFLGLAQMDKEFGRPPGDLETAGNDAPLAGRDKNRAMRPVATDVGQNLKA